MKTKVILITLFLLLALLFISLNLFQSSEGPHNGTVKQAGDYHIEMKNTPDYFFTYLLDKNRKPMSNKGIDCEVKFLFPDTTATTITLQPTGEDGFSTAASSLKFYSCRIYFKIKSKLISAQFDNENLIVQKNK